MDVRKEWLEEDYYAELGVNAGASAAEITKAYRKLARENHPDTHPDDKEAEDRFKRVTAAYEVLGDEERRKQYDQVRRFGAQGSGQGFTFDFDSDDLDDLFGGMFGSQGPFTRGRRGGGQVFTTFGGGRPGGNVPLRGQDLEATLRLPFDEAVNGMTTTVTLSDGGAPRDIKVRIPAGVKDGQTLRLAGKGGPGRNGGPDGDLLVTVSVAPHPVFDRRGDDLVVEVPITYAEAALGATIAVPTFGGGTVNVKIPPGTANGRTFRVKGRGVHTDRGTGNLLAKVTVTVPTELTTEQADALRAYAELVDEDPRARLGGS